MMLIETRIKNEFICTLMCAGIVSEHCPDSIITGEIIQATVFIENKIREHGFSFI